MAVSALSVCFGVCAYACTCVRVFFHVLDARNLVRTILYVCACQSVCVCAYVSGAFLRVNQYGLYVSAARTHVYCAFVTMYMFLSRPT